MGLREALERYDPELGAPFWAYAGWWVRQAMQALVAELTRPMVLSVRALRQLAQCKGAQRRFGQEHGREPSSGELAAESGLAHTQVERLLAADRGARGLDEPVGGDDGAGATIGANVPDPGAEDAYAVVQQRFAAAQVDDLLEALSDRERTVLRGRFGLDGAPQTLRQLAVGFGVSPERVRQIEESALEKLRAAVVSTAHRPARAIPRSPAPPRHRPLCVHP